MSLSSLSKKFDYYDQQIERLHQEQLESHETYNEFRTEQQALRTAQRESEEAQEEIDQILQKSTRIWNNTSENYDRRFEILERRTSTATAIIGIALATFGAFMVGGMSTSTAQTIGTFMIVSGIISLCYHTCRREASYTIYHK